MSMVFELQSMRSLIIACLVITLIAIPCQGKSLSEGSDISIDGPDKDDSSSNANPPVYKIDDPISFPRDPSQYEAPTRKYVPPNDQNNSSKENGDESHLNTLAETQAAYFKMAGDVSGTGTFNNWRLIEISGKSRLKQSSSVTRTGNLNRSDIVSMIIENPSDNQNLSSTGLLDHIEFSGKVGGASYREWGSYTNMGDLFSNYFRTQTILKDFFFSARSYMNSTDDEIYSPMENFTFMSKSTKYNLDTGFIGSYGFKQESATSSLISGDYNGGFVLHTRISNSELFNLTGRSETWLPCCQNESNDHSMIIPSASVEES
jgi:hypothetical protein